MSRSMGSGGGGSRSSSGGRSMGGGSRSSGRSFSGSGRSYSSSSSSSRRVSSSSSSRPSSSSSSFGRYGSSHSSYRRSYGGPARPYYRRSYRRPAYYGGGSSGGCFSIFLYVIIIFFVLAALGSVMAGKSGQDYSGTAKLGKTKFTGEVYKAAGYYIDNSEGSEKFIVANEESALLNGFKNFYDRTGVFPFLYICETVPGGSSESNIKAYGEELYTELFSDHGRTVEGNLLILFVADVPDYYLIGGYDIGDVIDDKATAVICNKINRHWDNGENASQIFGYGLDDASKAIMAKSNAKTYTVTFIIVAGVVLAILILFKWWKARTAQKNKEQQDLENILNTPLETFGNQKVNDLAQKYENQQ